MPYMTNFPVSRYIAAGLLATALVLAGTALYVRQQAPSDEQPGEWPILITTMTHLEGNWLEAASNQVYFSRQASLVRRGMDVAEEYGAVLTIESEIPMAEGMTTFDDNLLAEALERGHGVGTHCDISPKTEFSDEEMTDEFLRRKELIDALVGTDNNLGCSGGGGPSDWYTGAVGAGFKFIDGGVGFHYLALPPSERPEGWTNQKIATEYYHDPAPQDFEQYFHPFLISEVGFTEDPDGDLLMSGGTLARVENISEVGGWSFHETTDCPKNTCPFTEEDAQAAIEFIREFAENDDRSRPAKITFYFATQAFETANDEALKAFFAAMQELVDEGLVEWASQREAYETVMEYYGR